MTIDEMEEEWAKKAHFPTHSCAKDDPCSREYLGETMILVPDEQGRMCYMFITEDGRRIPADDYMC